LVGIRKALKSQKKKGHAPLGHRGVGYEARTLTKFREEINSKKERERKSDKKP